MNNLKLDVALYKIKYYCCYYYYYVKCVLSYNDEQHRTYMYVLPEIYFICIVIFQGPQGFLGPRGRPGPPGEPVSDPRQE